MKPIINTRADLDALKGTPAYLPALTALAGTMTSIVDVAERPDDYGSMSYDGPEIAPQWQEVETLRTIEALGFTRAAFEAEVAAAEAEL